MADSKLSVLSSASLPLPGNAEFYVVVGGASYKTTLADILDNAGDYLPRVDGHADLPVTLGDPAVDALYLVRNSSGVWPINRKPKGIWRRIANDGDLDDWEYWGDEQALADMFGSYQPIDSDLTAIAALAPSNDDVIQRKAGVWTNRTMAQLKSDLAVAWGDISGKPSTFAPSAHSTSHTDGTDDIQSATASQKGLATAAQITKLDGIDAKASAKKVIGIEIGDGTNVITTGTKGYIRVPWACTITKATVLETSATPVAGSIVLDVWKDTYANFPPTNADSITASAKPTLSTATNSEDSTLTGWTTSIAAGDTLGVEVESVTGCKRVLLLLEVTLT